jgi:hypothetical protein
MAGFCSGTPGARVPIIPYVLMTMTLHCPSSNKFQKENSSETVGTARCHARNFSADF